MEARAAVNERYSQAAQEFESMPCCPGTAYLKKYLEAIPAEVLERDYGCGDPTEWLDPGDVVLDLGSGGGKMCFVAAQIVGPGGRIIGVDMNDEMLNLAASAKAAVADRLGYANVEFRKGCIEDLRLDLRAVDDYLRHNPIQRWTDMETLEEILEDQRKTHPLVADGSVDVVLSNCVLNLVSTGGKRQLFSEIYRVLRKGGRAIISDVISDEPVPNHLRQDPQLWSGCVSGAFTESEFIEAFEKAGFHGITIERRAAEPYLEIEGIEFRTITIRAWKGKEGPCFEHYQAAIYKGPFKSVRDDDGHEFERGQRIAVCKKTFDLLSSDPYRQCFELVEPRQPVAAAEALPFACTATSRIREPHEQKNAPSSLKLTPDFGAERGKNHATKCC